MHALNLTKVNQTKPGSIDRGFPMATSLYDMSIPSYLQVLGAASGFMRKGAEHCAEHGLDPGELVEASLREDMLPFRFQVISICHHSLGAIRGIQEGVFTPPPPTTYCACLA
jgi:hypothetical protein